MLISLAGLPGVGKTAIARELARRLHAVHVRIDTIEGAMRRSAAHAALPMDDCGYLVGYAVAEDNLVLGRTVIADSVNPWPLTRDAWIAVATRTAVPAMEVEIVCSDLHQHRHRVESRQPDIPGSTPPTWKNVIERDYRSWDRDRMVVDTANATPEECADRILSAN